MCIGNRPGSSGVEPRSELEADATYAGVCEVPIIWFQLDSQRYVTSDLQALNCFRNSTFFALLKHS